MKSARRSLFALALVFLASGSASADVVSDAQAMRSVYYGSYQIDSFNPVSFLIETALPNQALELKLTSKQLDLTPLDVMGYLSPDFKLQSCDPLNHRDGGCNSQAITPVTWGQFQIWIDGCNVSDALTNLCNAQNCWAVNPTTARTPDGTLGSEFTFASAVSLNQIDASTCPAGSFSGFTDDKQYKIEFHDALNETTFVTNSGGRVDYEISVHNEMFTSSKAKHGKGNHK